MNSCTYACMFVGMYVVSYDWFDLCVLPIVHVYSVYLCVCVVLHACIYVVLCMCVCM